eukprot:4971223-Heterocapsa_arctica.AAC.1
MWQSFGNSSALDLLRSPWQILVGAAMEGTHCIQTSAESLNLMMNSTQALSSGFGTASGDLVWDIKHR